MSRPDPRRPARTVLRRAAIVAAGSVAALSVGSGAAQAAGNAALTDCTVNLQASSLSLHTGQALILTWDAIGAGRLTGSWTPAALPLVGAVTTTNARPGSYYYQVTGTSGGRYCGSAGVQVVFTSAAVPSSSIAPSANPSATTPAGGSSAASGGSGGSGQSTAGGSGVDATTAGSGGSNGSGGAAGPGGSGGPAGSGGGLFPAQSPTGGAGIAWLAEPVNLLGLSALTLIGAALFWKRDRFHAAIARRH